MQKGEELSRGEQYCPKGNIVRWEYVQVQRRDPDKNYKTYSTEGGRE